MPTTGEVGGVVGERVRAPPLAGGGRYVDYLAARFLLLELRHERLCAEIRPRHFDVQDELEDAVFKVEDGDAVGAPREGGVVDEHIHAPELRDRPVDHVLDVFLVGDVRHERQRLDAVRLHLLGDAVNVAPADRLLVVRERRGVAPRAGDDDVRAEFGEADRRRPSDSPQPAGSGDYRNFSVKFAHR